MVIGPDITDNAPSFNAMNQDGDAVNGEPADDRYTATFGVLATIYSANMTVDPGWTRSGEWAFGHPTGGGAVSFGYPDPSNGYTGSNVMGVNLLGDYSIALGGPYYLKTAAINCSGHADVQLDFRRWLNTDYAAYVTATIDVSNNGSTWTNVFSNPGSIAIADYDWHHMTYDISAVADGHSTVYVRWGYQVVTDGAYAYSGWNIDDVYVTGTPTGPDTAGPKVTAHAPTGKLPPGQDAVQFVFDEPMDTASFSVADDIATFTGPGGVDLKPQISSFDWTDEKTLEVHFAGQSAAGTYSIAIGPAITDDAPTFNLMNQDGDAINGESPDDRYTAAFIIALGQIEGDKWHDLDADGQRDAGEPLLSGWTIYLDSDNDGVKDTGEPSTVTDADGHYRFVDLAAGSYVIREVGKAGWLQTAPRVAVLESFDDGNMTEYASFGGTTNASASATAAHDGAYGMAQTDGSGWVVRNDAPVQVSQGEKLSTWVRLGGSGRAYFGFGATPSGTLSAVLASNSSSFILQYNSSYYYFSDLVSAPQTYLFNHWYRTEIDWKTGGQIEAKLYDSDGVMLLNTISASYPSVTSGGIAFRAIGSGVTSWDAVARGSDAHVASIAAGDEVTGKDFGNIALPAPPADPSPGDGATGVSRLGLVLDWGDCANAASYDLYLDNMTTPLASNLSASQWTVSPVTTVGAHAWKVVAKNAGGVAVGPLWSFDVATMLPGVPSNPTPAVDAYQTTKPLTLDWDDSPFASSYDIYFGANTSPTANVTVSQYGPITPADGTRLWRVVARNADGSTAGPQWRYFMDSVAPTATFGGETPAVGGATFDFTVTYADATSGVDASSFGDGDVTVTGPNGFSQAALFVSASGNVATYRITAPGGTWDVCDSGGYAISQNSAEVQDVAGNACPTESIGTFVAAMPFAWMDGAVLTVQFMDASQKVQLAREATQLTATQGGVAFSFAADAVTSILVNGTSGDDELEFGGAITQPICYCGTSGNDAMNIKAGTYTFCEDCRLMTEHLNLIVGAEASVVLQSTQHLAGLNIAGNVTVEQNGGHVIWTDALAFSPTGRLDLKDNDLIIRNGVIGSWDGTAYTGVTGMLASGYNGGAWDGAGIVTSMSAATGGNTLATLAAASAAELFGITAGQTALWGAETVDGTCVLVKYTYAGDANLGGVINGDDYFRIDSAFPQALHGWTNGDFNYDGMIDGDDYFLIDSNFPQQPAVL